MGGGGFPRTESKQIKEKPMTNMKQQLENLGIRVTQAGSIDAGEYVVTIAELEPKLSLLRDTVQSEQMIQKLTKERIGEIYDHVMQNKNTF